MTRGEFDLLWRVMLDMSRDAYLRTGACVVAR